jgi:hypothetical protein
VEAIRAACRKAVESTNAQWARLEKKGLIRPGENVTGEENVRVEIEYAVMDMRHNIYAQLDADIRSAKMRTEAEIDKARLFLDWAQTAQVLGGPSRDELKKLGRAAWEP